MTTGTGIKRGDIHQGNIVKISIESWYVNEKTDTECLLHNARLEIKKWIRLDQLTQVGKGVFEVVGNFRFKDLDPRNAKDMEWIMAGVFPQQPPFMQDKLHLAKTEAYTKALDSLARYKFLMFGYWAAQWVTLNKLEDKPEPNPFKDFVDLASNKPPEPPTAGDQGAQ